MKYAEALSYLMEQLPMFQRVGAAAYRTDLGNITELCTLLGNPERSLRCIHIAGTNGKGSVTHLIAAILQAQGYKVGVFTSPHYKDYRERIKINGQLISKQFITKIIAKNHELFKKVDASFFEITNAIAFEYFKQKKVDFAIIETGMGGRLDSTNIINPLISVITNISFDHQQFLGDTLAAIAKEKAGIIKEKTPIIIGETNPETKQVFIEEANKKNSPIYFADQFLSVENFKRERRHISFQINEISGNSLFNKNVFASDLVANYQKKNIITTIQSILELKKTIQIDENAIHQGLKNVIESTYFIGRWMEIKKHPTVIFDSAHNEGGWREVTQQLKNYSFKKLHVVYGTVADKDLQKLIPLLPKQAVYYLCAPKIPRAMNIERLSDFFVSNKMKALSYQHVKQAYNAALYQAEKEDLVLVAGSIFVVGELI